MIDKLASLIRDVPDFPKPGIVFKDITPLLADRDAFGQMIALMADQLVVHKPDVILGIESRGFIFAAALAQHMKCGLILVRKPGKLPHKIQSVSYELEYGTDRLEIHLDAISAGQRVAIVDDVLATGGTAAAAVELVRKVGGNVACVQCLLALSFLRGTDKLDGVPFESLITY